MSLMKHDYYVAIINNDNTLSYVTDVDNSTKTFYYKEGEPAKKFSKDYATDLMESMALNCYAAVVLTAPKNGYILCNKSTNETDDEILDLTEESECKGR